MSGDLGNCGSIANRGVPLDPLVRYRCMRCGNCCRWPGDVRVDADEVSAIAAHLGMGEEEFIARFTRLRGDRQGLSLGERNGHDCVMFENGACRIHPVKPRQCRGFPNLWNFPGWRAVCEAVPEPVVSGAWCAGQGADGF